MSSSLALKARGVGVAFASSSSPVLTGVDTHLTPGWYGLVGANGAGKTTLLRVLSGELTPTEGSVVREPRDALAVVCAQEPEGVTADVAAFAADEGGRASALRGRLRLDELPIARWPTLSPGERKRWQIGAALAQDPDLLLLDEPTNHLDPEGRALLVGALQRFRGIGVVVSHDRALLEELATTTIRVHDASVSMTPGAYGAASATWEAEANARATAHERARDAVHAAKRQLADARREHQGADAGRSMGRKMKNKHDHDSRSMGAKVVAGWAEARAGKTVAVARDAVARLEREVPEFSKDRTLGRSVFANYERPPRAVMFHVEVKDHPFLADLSVTIQREERVRIAGPNGAGKTTLLRELLRAPPPRVLYLPQELEEVPSLRDLDPEARGRVVSIFAALGSDPTRIIARRDDALSPGEARKLALSLGLGEHAWALVLDEPTNHLDLPSIERLEAALVAFPGTVVLVTHDDAFASRVCTRTLRLEAAC